MQLYILSKDPIIAAKLIPDTYKFKMLIELGQLICSAGLSEVYKYRPQGKELQHWITHNASWTYSYFCCLLDWSVHHVDMKAETINKLTKIRDDLWRNDFVYGEVVAPDKAFFRYAAAYKCDIPSKTLVSIDQCIELYTEYLQWKLNGATK